MICIAPCVTISLDRYFIKLKTDIGGFFYRYTLLVLEYTVHPGVIVIKITGSEDRVVRVNNEVNDKVNG